MLYPVELGVQSLLCTDCTAVALVWVDGCRRCDGGRQCDGQCQCAGYKPYERRQARFVFRKQPSQHRRGRHNSPGGRQRHQLESEIFAGLPDEVAALELKLEGPETNAQSVNLIEHGAGRDDTGWRTFMVPLAEFDKIDLRTNTEIWDALSFQIPLMLEADENIKEYPYRAILKGEIDDYIFVLTSSKKVTYAGKEYKALQLVRTDPDRDRQLHIWLVPALNNIPIVIENYRDGKEHSRGQLESLSFNNETPLIDQIADDNGENDDH